MHRRYFIKTTSSAGLGALSGWVPTLVAGQAPTPRRILIDADTANEIDDLYAIVRALAEPNLNIVGLSSAQWNHRLSPPETVLLSQKLNEDLLMLMERYDIPSPMGAEMIMGKPWGGEEPRDSPAVQLMIREARRTPEGEKLVIASLGAVTNVASAIKLAPDIIPKIACYMLSGRFYAERKVWDKDEFNLRNDLNAANFLFNTEGLELHVMPVNILLDFKFRLEEVLERLAGKGNVGDYLATRWLTHSPSSKTWIMWDLALMIAILRPDLATQASFMTPPENTQREVQVYTAVNAEAMLEDWWSIARKVTAKEQ